MSETVRLGEFGGIRVGANWTVLVVFALILLGLAGGQLPALHPDQATWAYVVAGTVAAAAFLASLLAHEMAHALVARRNGIHVDGITLWLFGGVARLRSEADDPATDLRVAGVGPLVSLALGALFGALALIADPLGLTGLPVGVLSWLAVINVVLAVFNLIPAAPLDGGRILRAVLWRRHGDRTRAAVTAARAGRTFGLVLVGVGLAEIVLVPGFGGLWLMLVGWFVITAAGAEEQQAQVQGGLAGIRVADVMSPDPVAVPARLSVADLVEDYVWRHRFSSFPVEDEQGRTLGLVTLGGVKEVPRERRPAVAVEQIARPLGEVPTASPGQPLAELLPRVSTTGGGRVLVLEGERAVGIVSPIDVARTLELAELGHGPVPAHH